ncbi:hypothetical protein B0H14DRAFT_2633771 [Mycena olivaceomarginata]|nr:hypothetical protein B0H14DRAFT_2633771 [Mycena olivaceomarginata]
MLKVGAYLNPNEWLIKSRSEILDVYDQCCIVEDPQLSETCNQLGSLVHKGLLSLKLSQPLTDKEYEDPHGFLALENTLCKLAVRSGIGSKRCLKPLVNTNPILATLIPKKLSFGISAIIIREALSERCGTATKDTTLFRRMLTGHHPTIGALTRQGRDQIDPICADLLGFRWLKKVLPFLHLTTGTRLSSLLVFMGTGQGSSMSEFLGCIEPKPNKMHFTSLEECIQGFTA